MIKNIVLLALTVTMAIISLTAYAGEVNTECSTGSTTCNIVTGAASTTVKPAVVFFSIGAADTITFKCGSTDKFGQIHLNANTSGWIEFIHPERGRLIECAAGETFSAEKGTASTPLTIWADYDQW